MKKEYTIKETKKLPHSEVEITGEISVEALASHRPHVLEHLKAHIDLPGFRKGKIPEAMIVSKIGELGILHNTAEHIIEEVVPEILSESKALYISRPTISITKLDIGSPAEFSIRITVMPEVKAPDYKALAHEVMSKKDEAVVITDADVEKVVEDIRRRMATPVPAGSPEGTEPVLPTVDETFIKQIGEFKDVADFKAKISENIKLEREHRNREKKRLAVAEKLIEAAKIEVPDMFVEQELAVIEARFKDDITRMGVQFADYLKHIKKTENDLRLEWRPESEKKVALELILAEIGRIEKVTPDQEVLDKEVTHLLEQYPGADKDRVTTYVTKQMIQDKVFALLETF